MHMRRLILNCTMQVHLELREQWPQRVEVEGAGPAEEGVQAKIGQAQEVYQAQRKGNRQPRKENGREQLQAGQVKIMVQKRRGRLTKEQKKGNIKLPRSDA